MARDERGGSARFGKDKDVELRFIIDGEAYSASRQSIKARLSGVRPDPITKHYVLIDGHAYPVKQVFSLGFGLPRMTFTTQRAVAALVRLGFDVGEVDETTAVLGGAATGGFDGDPPARLSESSESGDRYVVNTFTPDGERWQVAFTRDGGGRYDFDHVQRYHGT